MSNCSCPFQEGVFFNFDAEIKNGLFEKFNLVLFWAPSLRPVRKKNNLDIFSGLFKEVMLILCGVWSFLGRLTATEHSKIVYF